VSYKEQILDLVSNREKKSVSNKEPYFNEVSNKEFSHHVGSAVLLGFC
jgi:hypothetical protein